MPSRLLEIKIDGRPFLSNRAGDAYKEITDNINQDDPLGFSQEVLRRMKNFKPSAPQDRGQAKKFISGAVFEYLMAELLVWHKILPFYTQASMRFVPLSRFDFLCYNARSPVVFSTKISLAERWRQTAFEGDSLKRVYRQAKCYLVTENESDASNRNKDINEENCIGIDRCLVMGKQELITLLEDLSKITFTATELINPLERGKIIQM